MLFLACEFCSTTFSTTLGYGEHNCTYKQRYNYITKSARGISTYRNYLSWLQKSGKMITFVDEHTFIHSRLYKAFTNFTEMSHEFSLPSVATYIDIMIMLGITPQNWTNKAVIERFYEEYDFTDPNKHIAVSVDTIFKLCDGLECSPVELFNVLDGDAILILIKSRKLSPWLLLHSNSFHKYLLNKASAAERDYIQMYINPKKWRGMVSKYPDVVEDIRILVAELFGE